MTAFATPKPTFGTFVGAEAVQAFWLARTAVHRAANDNASIHPARRQFHESAMRAWMYDTEEHAKLAVFRKERGIV